MNVSKVWVWIGVVITLAIFIVSIILFKGPALRLMFPLLGIATLVYMGNVIRLALKEPKKVEGEKE